MHSSSSSSAAALPATSSSSSSFSSTAPCWWEVLQEFFECVIHTLLYTRKIYPSYLFESRRYLGVMVWQSRHPEINAYIRRVLTNCQELLQQNLLDKLIFQVEDEQLQVTDQIVLKVQLLHSTQPKANFEHGVLHNKSQHATNHNAVVNVEQFQHIEEELRSIILSLMLADQKLPSVSENCEWKILAVTFPATSLREEDTIKTSLTSGEWLVDNNQLPEQLSLAHRMHSSSAESPSSASSAPKLKPFKSFRNEDIHISVYAQVYKHSV